MARRNEASVHPRAAAKRMASPLRISCVECVVKNLAFQHTVWRVFPTLSPTLLLSSAQVESIKFIQLGFGRWGLMAACFLVAILNNTPMVLCHCVFAMAHARVVTQRLRLRRIFLRFWHTRLEFRRKFGPLVHDQNFCCVVMLDPDASKRHASFFSRHVTYPTRFWTNSKTMKQHRTCSMCSHGRLHLTWQPCKVPVSLVNG